MGKEFKERMEIIARRAGNPSILARKAGVSRRTISMYLSGESDPSRERLIRLAEASQVNIEWLAAGTGQVSGPQVVCRQPGERSAGRECLMVPLCDPSLHRSDQRFDPAQCTVDRFPLCPDLLFEAEGLNANNAFLFRNEDTSMLPTILPGDLVLADTISTSCARNRIHVFFSNGTLLLRRVQFSPGGRFVLAADDPRFPSQVIDHSELEVMGLVGRVVWDGRMV